MTWHDRVIAGSSKFSLAVSPRHPELTTKRRLMAGGGVRVAATEALEASVGGGDR